MEMDLGSTIIGTIAIIICALPFVMMRRTKKKREKKFFQELSKNASQNNCQIDQHEVCGNFAIGLDQTKNVLFFHRQTNGNLEEQVVDLCEIKSCEVIKTFKNGGGNQKVIDTLELSLIPAGRNNPEVNLEFFQADVSSQLNGEHQSIEKWSKLINHQLKVSS